MIKDGGDQEPRLIRFLWSDVDQSPRQHPLLRRESDPRSTLFEMAIETNSDSGHFLEGPGCCGDRKPGGNHVEPETGDGIIQGDPLPSPRRRHQSGVDRPPTRSIEGQMRSSQSHRHRRCGVPSFLQFHEVFIQRRDHRLPHFETLIAGISHGGIDGPGGNRILFGRTQGDGQKCQGWNILGQIGPSQDLPAQAKPVRGADP